MSGRGPRVLLVSSNGAGMGHLTRLVAMARRRGPGTDVHLLSMSQAVPVAADGLPWTYVPSAGDLGIGSRRWNALLLRRLRAELDRLRPDVVVFDGAYPYSGVLDAVAERGGVRLVWSRRGMWKPDQGAAQLARCAGAVDLVVQPGEVAASADRGLTAGRGDALVVRPVTLLDEPDLLHRAAARRALGLDPDRPVVLVSLGAGNLADVTTDRGAVLAALRAHDVQVAVTQPAIAGTAAVLDAGAVPVAVYPVSRYLRAVDAAVVTAGYNSFHESVAFAVPSAFVANTTQLDDQGARAAWAQDAGVGLRLDPRGDVAGVLARLVDPAEQARLAAACRAVWPGNGAAEAMAAVERVAGGEGS